MTRKQNLRVVLIAALWLLALGGWGLHLFFHPPGEERENWLPFIAGLASLILVPLLFSFKRTLAYAYVLNGMLAIIGTIVMAKSKLLPDIAVLWAKFLVGKAVFDLEQIKDEQTPRSRGRFWRYPNMGWWWTHLAAMTAVFMLGYTLWP